MTKILRTVNSFINYIDYNNSIVVVVAAAAAAVVIVVVDVLYLNLKGVLVLAGVSIAFFSKETSCCLRHHPVIFAYG